MCLLTKEDETGKPEDDIYLAINHVVPKELIYWKYQEPFPTRNKLFKYIYVNSCNINSDKVP